MLFHRTWSVGRRSKGFGTRVVAVRNSSSTDLHEAGSRIPQLVKQRLYRAGVISGRMLTVVEKKILTRAEALYAELGKY